MLLLDELTSFLDAGDQAAVLRAVRTAVDGGGVTAVWVRGAPWAVFCLAVNTSSSTAASAPSCCDILVTSRS